MPKGAPGFLKENVPYSCRAGDYAILGRYSSATEERRIVNDFYVDHKRKRLHYDFNLCRQVLGFKKVAIHHTMETHPAIMLPLAVIAVLIIDWDDFHDKQLRLGKLKFRCQSAKVIGLLPDEPITRRLIKEGVVAHSMYDPDIIYKENEIVSSDDFDDNPDHECAPGIHYFTDINMARAFIIHC